MMLPIAVVVAVIVVTAVVTETAMLEAVGAAPMLLCAGCRLCPVSVCAMMLVV